MRKLVLAMSILGGTLAGVAPAAPSTLSQPVALSPGDPAPDFTLNGSDGRTYRLADYRGEKTVVLAWFAKAFTGG